MNKKIPFIQKINHYIVFGLSSFYIIYALFFAAHIMFYTYQLNEKKNLGLRIEIKNDSLAVIKSINPELKEEYSKYSINLGDTIISANNTHITSIDTMEFHQNTYTAELIKNKDTLQVELKTIDIPIQRKIVTFALLIAGVMILLFYSLTSIWVLIRSPYSSESILIALFCILFGSMPHANLSYGISQNSTYIAKMINIYQIKDVMAMITLLAPGVWVWLFYLFPKKANFYIKNKITAILSAFILPLLSIFIIYSNHIMTKISSNFVNIAIFLLIMANLSFGINLFISSAKKIKSYFGKRQLKLLAFGLKYGGISIGISWAMLIFVFRILDSQYISILLFFVFQLAGLLIPIAFLNSFLGNKIFETESLLKRKLRYFVISLAIFSIYAFILFHFAKGLILLFDLKDPNVIIIMVLLSSSGFAPLQRFVMKYVDKWLYPEKTEYISLLNKISNDSVNIFQENELLDFLLANIKSIMKIKKLFIKTFTNPIKKYELLDQKPLLTNITDQKIQNIIFESALKDGVFYWSEAEKTVHKKITDPFFSWVRNENIFFSIPIIYQEDLLGFLHIGEKNNHEEYSSLDLRTLKLISDKASISIVNIRLQNEYLIKKRMEDELEVAYKIQRQLLPQNIPNIHGIDIYADSIPCYEVAGDYYDIIKINDNHYLFAIGDVTGKGAGSALLMSNLHAALRIAVENNTDLEKTIFYINNHLCKYTSPEQFITFFAVFYDIEKNQFKYINAGHNPPLILKSNDSILRLDNSGMVLGFLENQKYELSDFQFEKDDILLIYTDGLEEAMNEDDEEYSVDRIENDLKNFKNLDSKEFFNQIKQNVTSFSGKADLKDDITLIFIKKD